MQDTGASEFRGEGEREGEGGGIDFCKCTLGNHVISYYRTSLLILWKFKIYNIKFHMDVDGKQMNCQCCMTIHCVQIHTLHDYVIKIQEGRLYDQNSCCTGIKQMANEQGAINGQTWGWDSRVLAISYCYLHLWGDLWENNTVRVMCCNRIALVIVHPASHYSHRPHRSASCIISMFNIPSSLVSCYSLFVRFIKLIF